MSNSKVVYQFQVMYEVISQEDIRSFIDLGYKRVGRKGMVFQKQYDTEFESILDQPNEYFKLMDKYNPYVLYQSFTYFEDGVISHTDVVNTKSIEQVEKTYLEAVKEK